ncbi:MAG: APC family permease [Gammaproteobacteria bacterium]|nr:APC family permease [Gammaproteobacteria bacterium]MCF6259267.1 APC family permease [Gammaproteobacteria bacterium]
MSANKNNAVTTSPEKNKKMGLWQVVALAVGTMVGASIFSIFGLGARLAGPNLPLVFVLSGIVALLVAYSYARLGSRIISDAGPIEFILRGMGDSLLTGALSFLFWLTYVVSIALFAKGFASYLLPLLHIQPSTLSSDITETGVVLAFLALGMFGSAAVGKAELIIVVIKLSILALFVVLGIWSIKTSLVTPSFTSSAVTGSVNAIAIFFLSYMGFGLVTNASEHMQNPEKNVPRAIYLSIFIVSTVYILVSLVAVGNLTLPDLIKAQDNALAVAAEPFLGQTGFLLISLGALFSIASALNATLFGGANVAYALARDGELPQEFNRKLWFGSGEGLYLTAALGIVFALTFNLNGIASITSGVFMVIYLFVLYSHWKLKDRYGGNPLIIATGFLVVAAVFLLLLNYQWHTDRNSFYGTCIVLGGSVLVELVYRGITKRGFIQRELALLKKEKETLRSKMSEELDQLLHKK